jgi:hypothetical protein
MKISDYLLLWDIQERAAQICGYAHSGGLSKDEHDELQRLVATEKKIIKSMNGR